MKTSSSGKEKTARGKQRQVALLRGINVGRAKRVAMADLRALVEKLGYRDVSSLLNSGNLAFTAFGEKPEQSAVRIEEAIEAKLGISSRVIVLSSDELAKIIAENPLPQGAGDPSRLLVAVLNDPADRKELSPLRKKDWEPEELAIGKRAAYLWCPEGILKSQLVKEVGRALGTEVTTRNVATMLKLKALAESYS